MTREEQLRTEGWVLCSPVSGSMRPMIRPRRDRAKFVLPEGELKRLDVALYRAEDGKLVMHRVLKVLPEGYFCRGDYNREGETVGREQILGVMEGYFREEKYMRADARSYRLFVRLWVALHPLLGLYKGLRRAAGRIKRKITGKSGEHS